MENPPTDGFPEGAPMDFQMYVRSQVGPWMIQFYNGHLIMLGNYSWEICGNTNENCDIYHNRMDILGNTNDTPMLDDKQLRCFELVQDDDWFPSNRFKEEIENNDFEHVRHLMTQKMLANLGKKQRCHPTFKWGCRTNRISVWKLFFWLDMAFIEICF